MGRIKVTNCMPSGAYRDLRDKVGKLKSDNRRLKRAVRACGELELKWKKEMDTVKDGELARLIETHMAELRAIFTEDKYDPN